MQRIRPSIQMEPFFAMRTPLLPQEVWREWGEALLSRQAAGEADMGSGEYQDIVERLRERLRYFVARPDVLEALFVASPDLVASIPRWISAPDSEKGQRTELALVRYFSRMCHRPTPFGLFAGHSLGRAGSETRLVLGGKSSWTRKSRLDMTYLCGLASALAKDLEVRGAVLLRPNTSLYRLGERLRYGEIRENDGRRMVHLVSVRENASLTQTLEKARNGADAETLARALASPEVTMEEAAAFIHQLVDFQLLVPDLEPPTTGEEPTWCMIRTLLNLVPALPIAEGLERAARALGHLDVLGLGNDPKAYEDVEDVLKGLPGPVDRSKLWQVDLFKPAPEASLGEHFRREMTEAVHLLHRLTPKDPTDPLKAFKEAFAKRYGERWVPLSEALDPESGVGLAGTSGRTLQGAPLLEGFALGATSAEAPPTLKPREVYLLKKLVAFRQGNGRVLNLDLEDVEALADDRPVPPLPHAFSLLAEVAAGSTDALAAGEYQVFIHAASGPSGARLLGRFCHGDPALAEAVQGHLRREEACQPHAVFAEVAYLPQPRMGNVLARPRLRDHEIPYLGRSGVDPERMIQPEDLCVGLVDQKVVLWSRKLDRQVVPRLTSAANFTLATPEFVQFLGLLQEQDMLGWVGFSWGMVGKEPFLPRVVHGRLVLSRATWWLDKADLQPLHAAKSPRARFIALQRLRERRDLPRHLLLPDGDNELPVDLDNPLVAEAVWGIARQREQLTLTEDFPGSEALVAQGPEGTYTHELVLPFLAGPESPLPPLPSPSLPATVDRHAPGSRWLYAKLHTGMSTADRLLAEAVAPLVHEALESGEARQWFFIRYLDPEPHIRIRFLGEPDRLWGSLLRRLHQRLGPELDGGSLWNLQIDTYEPEIDRYGGSEGMELAVEIFQADSEAVLKILGEYRDDDGKTARWRLALASMDEFLHSAGLDVARRLVLAERQYRLYEGEFALEDGPGKQHLGMLFRRERYHLYPLVLQAPLPEGPLVLGLAALRERSLKVAPLFERLRELEAQGRLRRPLEDLLESIIHMGINRLLTSGQRFQEMVLYNFALRMYRSKVLREPAQEP